MNGLRLNETPSALQRALQNKEVPNLCLSWGTIFAFVKVYKVTIPAMLRIRDLSRITIPDPRSKISLIRIRNKEQRICEYLNSRKYDTRFSSPFPDLDFFRPRSRSRGQQSMGSRIRIQHWFLLDFLLKSQMSYRYVQTSWPSLDRS